MAVRLAPDARQQFFDNQGNVLNGGKLFFYAAGSATKQNTYTDSTGAVANANPIILDADGRTPDGVWLTEGLAYKVVLAPANDTDPPTSPIWTEDNIRGVNDTALVIDQWFASGLTPTYVSSTSFTVPGDQTVALHPSRRTKTTNTSGTVYSTIISSTFGALTTVVVASESGGLDSGLSALSYGVVTATNTSIDADMINRKGAAVASAATCNIWAIAGNYCHITGTTGISSFSTAPYAGAVRRIIHDGAVTLTHGTNLKCPGDQDLTLAANDMYEVVADTTTAMRVVSVTRAFSRPAQFPAGYIQGLTYANNVADATNDIDIAVGAARDSTDAMDMVLTTALAKQSDAAWAVGNNAGGLDLIGSAGNNDFYVHLIKRSDTGVVDVLFSLSATAPTMPTNYDYRRRIGWFRRAGGAILAFKTYELAGGGLEYQWVAPILDVNLANTLTTTRRTDALSVPQNLSVVAHVHALWADATTGSSNVICNPDEGDAAPSTTASPGLDGLNSAGTTTVTTKRVRTSTAGLVASRSTLATVDTYRVFTPGFEDARRT